MPNSDQLKYLPPFVERQQKETMREIANQLQGLQTELEQKVQAREDNRLLGIIASLREADMKELGATIRQIVREELQRQEGFIRCVVQEELEAHHDKGLDNLMADISEPVDEQEEIAAVLAEMTSEEWETLVQRVKARKASE